MERFITSNKNYSIWLLSESGLNELAKFVVTENYKHHQKNSINLMESQEEIREIYDEEVCFFPNSKIFVAKNNLNEIIGAIRVMKWNRKDELPIMKLFGIKNLNDISPENSKVHIWHIGRFAVSCDLKRNSILLFRMLMMYAVIPICQYDKGIMFAECDSKLFRTVNKMGLNAIALTDGIEYLGSNTIPMYATRDGMMEFVIRNCALASNIEENLNQNIPSDMSFFMQRIRA